MSSKDLNNLQNQLVSGLVTEIKKGYERLLAQLRNY